MRHAYLILAHTEFELLQILINTLDDERNDIFVHIDAKVKNLPTLKTVRAGLYFPERRVDVCWGDVSVIEAELTLFEASAHRGGYEYYHLLSGVDLPLKSQREIHEFFDRNSGKEFIGYSTYDYTSEVDRKVRRVHLFPKDFRRRAGVSGLSKRFSRALFLRLQILFCWRRNKYIDFKKGTQWVSVSDSFVAYLLSKKSEIMKIYRATFCGDEIYKQTICWNSNFREKIYSVSDEALGCLRTIGWRDGRLYDWEAGDFNKLARSNNFFARKFCSKDMDFIRRVANLARRTND